MWEGRVVTEEAGVGEQAGQVGEENPQPDGERGLSDHCGPKYAGTAGEKEYIEEAVQLIKKLWNTSGEKEYIEAEVKLNKKLWN